MSVFEIGKKYAPLISCFDPITIVSRTEKTVMADFGKKAYRMLIHVDENGEFVRDSGLPKRHQNAGTFYARDEVTD